MERAADALRTLDHMQRVLGFELVGCLVTGSALFAVSGRVGPHSATDVQFVFLLCLAGFGATAAHLVPRLLEAALFRCPRCRGRFHAATRAARPVLRLRTCAHCRLPVRSRSGLDRGSPGGRPRA